MGKRVCIDDDPPTSAHQVAHKSQCLIAETETWPDDCDVGNRNLPTEIRYRRLGQQRPCGKARLLWHDKTDEPRACGSRTETSYHGRMREAMRAADDRNGADGTLVRVARTRAKAPCYLLGYFHVTMIIAKTRPQQKCRDMSA